MICARRSASSQARSLYHPRTLCCTVSHLRAPSRCNHASAIQPPTPSATTTRGPSHVRPRLAPPRSFVRSFTASLHPQHNHLDPPQPGQERRITFIDKEGESHLYEVADGDNLLDIALENDLEMEGACGGSCACSTCHVIVTDEDMYDKMEEPTDDENDMLDLAFGLTETSRLGCQIKMSKAMDGLTVKLPTMTRNLQASDFKAKDKSE